MALLAMKRPTTPGILHKLALWRGIASVAALAALTMIAGAASPSQPIAFSHRLHIYNGVTCTVCHPGAQDGRRAGLPTVRTCQGCHEDVLYESAEEAEIRRTVQSGTELNWFQVTRMQPYVYFSHKRHVRLGRLRCRQCHGDVESWDHPPRVAAIRLTGRPGMATCISCHETSIADASDCLLCHR
ncbi:MAG: cytochrome c3 family protein [Acidobacteriota bacterium]